jgi:hypothetical protein
MATKYLYRDFFADPNRPRVGDPDREHPQRIPHLTLDPRPGQPEHPRRDVWLTAQLTRQLKAHRTRPEK